MAALASTREDASMVHALELAKDDALALDGGQVAMLVHNIHILHPILCKCVILYLIDLQKHTWS